MQAVHCRKQLARNQFFYVRTARQHAAHTPNLFRCMPAVVRRGSDLACRVGAGRRAEVSFQQFKDSPDATEIDGGAGAIFKQLNYAVHSMLTLAPSLVFSGLD